MALILELSKRNEDSHMTVTIKVNYQTTFQKKEATK
ncbi:alanine racemase [Streptococcus mitis]|uniref:Alanine racemase n=1 Tax=Streptococcus mitis TaxID=28037 RepID=A0A7X1QXE8_STRMT|nr:alanine racemase [Streptococcus mitis]